MLKKRAFWGSIGALVLLALAAPSFAATVKITDSDLRPATVAVNRGEEVTWVDATTDRAAHVDLDFGQQAGIRITMTKGGDLRAKFDKPGTYEYAAHIGVGSEGHPHEIRGKVVVK